mgnify:CR=1 FL=1
MTTYKQLQDSWIRSEWVDSNVEDFGGDELVFIPNTVSFGSVTLPDLMSKNITKTNYNDIIKIANYIMVINVDPIVDKIVNIFNNADVIYEFEDFYRLSERGQLVAKVVDILGLESSPVINLWELDNDVLIQDKIMALRPDFLAVGWRHSSIKKIIKDPTRIKRPWLTIIKTVLEYDYQRITQDYHMKVNNRFVHTKTITFHKKYTKRNVVSFS